MAVLNRVQLIGRLGKDPESHSTSKGTIVCSFSLAVDHRWRGADGVEQKETDWFNCETWRNQAEFCQKYAHKGQLVYLEGRLKTDHYESQGETRYFTKVVVNNIQLLEWRGEDKESAALEEESEIEE